MQPPAHESPAAVIEEDGIAAMVCGDHELVQHTRQMLVLDSEGEVLVCLEPRFHGQQNLAHGQTWEDVYPGVELNLTLSRGGLLRLLRIDEPLALPQNAHTVVFMDGVSLSGDLMVSTDRGFLAPGEAIRVTGGFRLMGESGLNPFHIPAAAAWDAQGRNRPWLEYDLTLDQGGCLLQVGTRVPAGWLTDPEASYPLTVDPSVLPEAPEPMMGSIFLAPTSPGSSTLSLAATYANARLDSLEVSIDWGDGTSSTYVTNWPVQELHRYASDRQRVTIQLQISDFTFDGTGQLAPRTERRVFHMFGPPDGKPGWDIHCDPVPDPEPPGFRP